MEYKYDAFISYRHAEKDTMIASEIQKSLERFKIPKALQKQTGKERFNRIFRDVEELPISSNLTEDLTEALRLSQFLIVICSYRTSESDWVKREIETFLELHDYNKQLIFTVLVEGEPDEVIPEELRHDNIIHYLADGTFYCKDEVVEPLAANYRMPIAKARKTELPRLAASMLGCNYDDIIRRRKAFRRRRLLIETVLISVAAIGLLSYIGWTLVKIQDNLRNAQMNQSRYLASESARLLDEGDRITAMQLALAALENSDGSRRPHTSEAEFALSAALGAYITRGSSYSSPVWRYEISSAVVKYDADNSGDYLAVLDSTGTIHIWNRRNHKETLLEDENARFLDFAFDKNDDLIVVSSDYVALYSHSTLNEIWKNTVAKKFSKYDVIMQYYRDKDYIALNDGSKLYVINAADGKSIMEVNPEKFEIFVKKREKTSYFFTTFRFLIDSDFTKIVLIGTDSKNSYSLYVYDVSKNEWTNPISGSGDILDASLDEDGNIMVLRKQKNDNDQNQYFTRDSFYNDSVILELISNQNKSVWKTELSSIQRIVDTKLISTVYTPKDKTGIRVVAASIANRCVIVDKTSGKIIKSYDLPGSIAHSVWLKSAANDTYINVVLRSGMAIWLPLEEKQQAITSYKYFQDGIIKMRGASSSDGTSLYFVEDSSERIITEYNGRFSDEKFIGFEDSDKIGEIRVASRTENGNYLVAFSDTGMISGIDLKNHKVLWSVVAQNATYSVFQSFSSDEKYTYFIEQTEKKCRLIRLNVLDGKYEAANNEFQYNSQIASEGVGRKIFSIVDDSREMNELTLLSFDAADESCKKTKIDISSIGVTAYTDKLYISQDGKRLIFYVLTGDSENTKIYRLIIDSETGKYSQAECGRCITAAWNDKGTMFAEAGESGNITVYSDDGTVKYTVDNEMRIPVGMQFHEDKLYVVYNTDSFSCYDKNGKETMDIALKHADLSEVDSVNFEFLRNCIFVTAGEYTDIINTEYKKSTGSFRGFLCLYNEKEAEKDISSLQIISKTYIYGEGARVGYFKYKTVSEMIKQAKEYLNKNGVTMSNEFKLKYGIE